MRCRRLLVAVTVLALAVLGACGGDDGANSNTTSATTTTAAAGVRATVTMKLIAFKPETIDVKAGQSVTWRQTDPGFHTVTSGTVEQGASDVATKPDGRFDSGQLATGKSFTFTFDEPGTYPYFCTIHPATMRGQVRVS